MLMPTTYGAEPDSNVAKLTPGGKMVNPHGPIVNPSMEYVAGGRYNWGRMIQTLPHYIDDTTRDFGDDLYVRMLHDAQIASCVGTFKAAILSQGLHIKSPVKQDDEDSELALDVQKFCYRQITRLDKPFVSHTLWNMLDSIAMGYKVAEMVYEVPTFGMDKDQICLRAIKVKPQETMHILVDPYANVVGFIGMIPGQGGPLTYTSFIADTKEKVPQILPRKKFALLTFRPHDEDPRGQSVIRPAYNAWYLKTQVWPEYLKYITQFAGPSLKGKLPPNAQKSAKVNPDGSIALDELGQPVILSPEQAMLTALEDFRNGTIIVLPNEADVETVWSGANIQNPFEGATALLNNEISKAILYQTLATEQSDHQTRAASETHQDVMELVVQVGREGTAQMVRNDILRPLVSYKYGEEVADRLTPEVSLSQTELHDFGVNATAIARLFHVGFIHPSQYAGLDTLLNLPVRADPEENGLAAMMVTDPNADPQAGSSSNQGENTEDDEEGSDIGGPNKGSGADKPRGANSNSKTTGPGRGRKSQGSDANASPGDKGPGDQRGSQG